MVFIIAGASELDRNTVDRLLAKALGWECFDAENLRPPANLSARKCC
jgi:hypothetical protein